MELTFRLERGMNDIIRYTNARILVVDHVEGTAVNNSNCAKVGPRLTRPGTLFRGRNPEPEVGTVLGRQTHLPPYLDGQLTNQSLPERAFSPGNS